MVRTLVYIAHPLGKGADRESNRLAAAKILCDLQETYKTHVFVASWITLASVWPESDHYRGIGIAADLALIDHCDEVWLVGPRISEGMQIEAIHATSLCKVVRDMTSPP